MRFGRRDSRQELEAELFESRPEPSETFVTALGARVEADRQRSRRRTYARLSLAWGISVLVFGSLAAFGGIGYAASSTIDVARSRRASYRRRTPSQRRYASSAAARHRINTSPRKRQSVTGRSPVDVVTITISALRFPGISHTATRLGAAR